MRRIEQFIVISPLTDTYKAWNYLITVFAIFSSAQYVIMATYRFDLDYWTYEEYEEASLTRNIGKLISPEEIHYWEVVMYGVESLFFVQIILNFFTMFTPPN